MFGPSAALLCGLATMPAYGLCLHHTDNSDILNTITAHRSFIRIKINGTKRMSSIHHIFLNSKIRKYVCNCGILVVKSIRSTLLEAETIFSVFSDISECS